MNTTFFTLLSLTLTHTLSLSCRPSHNHLHTLSFSLMHTPHSFTHPHSLYPTNYTSLTFIQTHSQSSFKAHSSHIHTQTHSYFNAYSSHILTHAHTLNLHLMHTPLTLTHLHSLCPTNYNPLTITHTLSVFL